MNAASKKEYVLKTVGWSLLLLLILEIFVRTFVYKTPLMQEHHDLGLIPKPGSYYVWGLEGFGVTHFLEDGEIVTPYTIGVSIAVLGDSFTEALQVNDVQKFSSVAENLLVQDGFSVNIHNLGASGRNIADYVYMAPFIIRKFAPHIIVLQISQEDFVESLNPSRANYFIEVKDGIKLVHQEVDYDISLQNLVRSSSLLSFGIHQMGSVADKAITNYALQKNNSEPQSENARVPVAGQQDLLNYQLNALRSAYPDTDILLLVVPNIPVLFGNSVIFDSAEDNTFIETLRVGFGFNVIYPKNEFIMLYDSLKVFPRGFSNSLPGTGHLNIYGHRVLGEVLAYFLEGKLR